MLPDGIDPELVRVLVAIFQDYGMRANDGYQKDASEPMTAPVTIDETTPTILSGDVDDYEPGTTPVLRLSSNASPRTITGIMAPANAGGMVLIVNVGANTIVLAHQNGSSDAANRLIMSTGADTTLAADAHVWIWYDGTTARWREVT